ncbi:hypothetical protein Pint_26405 [Pistacia integerrima]|uniref:Uncharacterized protein n=1 Tax=Pistacia integerrima TaxID=434235 RepID=A0ACC0YJC0_9ROSI|nr:hypothetical protein Pint_26405 [Pistacia integerrima]
MMAFSYYGASKPACLNGIESSQEMISSLSSAIRRTKTIGIDWKDVPMKCLLYED